MSERVCIRLNNNYEESYICNEEWFEYNRKRKTNSIKDGARYEVLRKGYITDMEDLIRHCLVYNYDIDIPEGYKVTTIYNIIFNSANFEPDARDYSSCNGDILYSSVDKQYIDKKFNYLCKTVNKKSVLNHENLFCWHTEDYATNQIIHSYSKRTSYIIEKIV